MTEKSTVNYLCQDDQTFIKRFLHKGNNSSKSEIPILFKEECQTREQIDLFFSRLDKLVALKWIDVRGIPQRYIPTKKYSELPMIREPRNIDKKVYEDVIEFVKDIANKYDYIYPNDPRFNKMSNMISPQYISRSFENLDIATAIEILKDPILQLEVKSEYVNVKGRDKQHVYFYIPEPQFAKGKREVKDEPLQHEPLSRHLQHDPHSRHLQHEPHSRHLPTISLTGNLQHEVKTRTLFQPPPLNTSNKHTENCSIPINILEDNKDPQSPNLKDIHTFRHSVYAGFMNMKNEPTKPPEPHEPTKTPEPHSRHLPPNSLTGILHHEPTKTPVNQEYQVINLPTIDLSLRILSNAQDGICSECFGKVARILYMTQDKNYIENHPEYLQSRGYSFSQKK